jgi:hypothetical protein
MSVGGRDDQEETTMLIFLHVAEGKLDATYMGVLSGYKPVELPVDEALCRGDN